MYRQYITQITLPMRNLLREPNGGIKLVGVDIAGHIDRSQKENAFPSRSCLWLCPDIKVRYCARRPRDLPGPHVRCKGKILDGFGKKSQNLIHDCLFPFKQVVQQPKVLSLRHSNKSGLGPPVTRSPLSSPKQTVWPMLAIHGGGPPAVPKKYGQLYHAVI